MNIFSLSFGKDSMATLILAAEQGISIDRVMYVEVKFNDEISGEHPIMAEWIPTAEKRLKELFGVTVDHAYSGIGYEAQFWTKKQKGSHVGDTYSFPYAIGGWCNDRLKMKAIDRYNAKYKKQKPVQFLGIAADEPNRWARKVEEMKSGKVLYRSLLVEQGLTENDAMEICKKYNLLSPLYNYKDTYRGGCWFCPKQCMADLYCLWEDYPDLYGRLLKMEPLSNTTFKPRGVTLAGLAERFESGYIPKRKKKARKFVQMDMFEKIDGGDVHDD